MLPINVLGGCFKAHYQANWAPLFWAVFPSDSSSSNLYVSFYTAGLISIIHFTFANRIAYKLIKYTFLKRYCTTFLWFPFQIADSQSIRKYRDEISLVYFRRCEVFLKMSKCQWIELRRSKKRKANNIDQIRYNSFL